MKFLSECPNDLVSFVLIVDDVNISDYTYLLIEDENSRLWSDYDLLNMYKSGDVSKLQGVTDFVTLDHMDEFRKISDEFGYELTPEQKHILSEGYANYLDVVEADADIQRLLELIKASENYTIPWFKRDPVNEHKSLRRYTNFYNEDYLSIIRQFDSGDYCGFIRSNYPDFIGDKIFQFSRNVDYCSLRGIHINTNVLMEINLKKTCWGDVVALISLNDSDSSNRKIVKSMPDRRFIGDSLTSDDYSEIQKKGTIVNIKIDDISCAPGLPETEMLHYERLNRLASVYKEKGIPRPVVVQRNGDKYWIVSGEDIWRAAKLAELSEIPAYIIECIASIAIE